MTPRVHAPEFPAGLPWLGTPRPLSMAALRGQVVVLDFWTYCCVNCQHVLPVLAGLAARRSGQPLVVIGVHSAKFAAERDVERVRQAAARHGISHPVVVDSGHAVRQAYAIRSWPTLVIVRPDGTLAAVSPGEAELGPLDDFVGQVMEEARRDGTLARAPLALLAPEPPPVGPLAFPGRVIAAGEGRLAVSDTRHHRVVLATADGRVLRVFGSGEPGLVDGAAEQAAFRDPQGLATDGRTLVVADTGNHAVREIDLASGKVSTLAGTGALGPGFPRGPLAALAAPMRSPWDVALAGDFVIVAMAGMHQLWAVDRRRLTLRVFAGSGVEGLLDGPFATAAFAQPSGLSLAGDVLFVADSETSAVRALDLLRGEVRTVVGEGLFEFGDVDGPRGVARLQHPLGLAAGPLGLLVADTYNDSIRRVDAATGAVSTFFRAADGTSLREPGGLCQLPDGRVLVADTNHHRLVEISHDGARARVLELRGLAPPRAATSVTAAAPPPAPPEDLDHVTAATGAVPLRLVLDAPSGFALAQGSAVAVVFDPQPGLVLPDPDGFTVDGERTTLDLDLRAPDAGEWTVAFHVDATVCGRDEAAACWPVSAAYRLPLRVHDGGPATRLEVDVPLPDPRG